MTKLYSLEMPVRLLVEADSIEEARATLDKLWWEVMEGLPVGAGAFMKDEPRKAFIRANAREG